MRRLIPGSTAGSEWLRGFVVLRVGFGIGFGSYYSECGAAVAWGRR